MKHLLICGLALSALLALPALSCTAARADQNLPQLDALFASLHRDLEAQTAASITREIWTAWLHHDDARVRDLMARGVHNMEVRRWRDALAQFNAVIKHAPDFAEAWNKRATVYFLMDDLAASSADVVEVLRLEPRHFGALAGQGMIYLRQDLPDLALIYFRRALAVNPHLHDVRAQIEILSRRRSSKAI